MSINLAQPLEYNFPFGKQICLSYSLLFKPRRFCVVCSTLGNVHCAGAILLDECGALSKECYSFYYIHFEITGDPCNLIGPQQCDLFTNRTILGSKSHLFFQPMRTNTKIKQPIKLNETCFCLCYAQLRFWQMTSILKCKGVSGSAFF